MTKIKRIKCGSGNCFLVYNGNDAILVDTGRTRYRKKILKECLGMNIVMIVLTHGHIDHIENAAFLSKELGASIAMNKKDCKLIKNNSAQIMTAHTILGKVVLAVVNNSYENELLEAFEPSIFIDHGYSFENYNIDAKVIELPGHTKGSIGMIVGEEDIIVGDALMNLVTPNISLLYGDLIDVKKSAERISNSNVRTIHFGHGKSVATCGK